ncbi:hypothetical protein ACFVGY_34365 [Streptomyces sp. NPDC127106]|uniref:hypothetical protein n=1 Tax=Streptomyces sp. NPDC127106 TaxID=3345360 RepID=UPI003635D72C
MHGPGLPPQQGPQPSSGGVVALRVLFALIPVLSCGFLGWATMLRLAILTRRTMDWVLLVVNFVLTVAWLVLIDADKTPNLDGWQSDAGAFGVILTGVATCIYFLVADIRHHERMAAARATAWYPGQPAPAPYVSPQQTQPSQPGYGYPQAQTQPMQPRLRAQPMPQPQPQPQPQPPAPSPATPPRIGQVRAELDELSELLRKQTPPPTPPRPEGEGPAR